MTLDTPSATVPSTGTASPGLTKKMSPTATSLTGTVTALPSRNTVAGLGGELHKALEGIGGAALAVGFQRLAHRDER